MGYFTVTKDLEVAGMHCLSHLPYKSKCKTPHGHNWLIKVTCRCHEDEINPETGMVIDFTEIKRLVMVMDHNNINEFLEMPTAEMMAKHICGLIPNCIKVQVIESAGNTALYEL